jgi:hemerythrin-like domain-containing protein
MMLTDQLKKENEKIRVILRILNGICEKIDSGQQVLTEDLDDIVDLIGSLVQRLHQEKEEDLLLSTTEDSPVDERGAFAALLADHRAIRKSFRDMKASLAKYHRGDSTALASLSDSARLYSRLLGEHLEMAEKDLYERADINLSRKKQRELTERFARLEKMGSDRNERTMRLRRIYLD